MNMEFEDLKQHFDKIATLYLKNNKRKVGWIYVEDNHTSKEEVCFVCVQKGRRVMTASAERDHNQLRNHREIIHLKDILRIRSSI